MNGGPPDARHAAPLKTGSLSVQSREKKRSGRWRRSQILKSSYSPLEMLSRKRLLPKRRLEFQVAKKKKKKKPESAGPSARGNESASNISKRKNGIQRGWLLSYWYRGSGTAERSEVSGVDKDKPPIALASHFQGGSGSGGDHISTPSTPKWYSDVGTLGVGGSVNDPRGTPGGKSLCFI